MNKSTKPSKQYIIRKLIVATSIEEALRKEKGTVVHEVFVDESYKPPEASKSDMGYNK